MVLGRGGLMADVFISHRRADRVWAERISQALRDVGISSWWDNSPGAGEQFNPAIDGELKACRCVVVIWSQTACDSPWVQAEAQHGFERGILVATRVQDVKLGTPFSVVQTLDLRTAGVEAVIQGVQLKLGAPVVALHKRRGSPAGIWSTLCLVAAVALSVVAWLGEESGDEIYEIALLVCWGLGFVGSILLFQSISRRSSFAAVLGGGLSAGIVLVISAAYWNTAMLQTSYALAILPYAPGVALLTAFLAFLVRPRG
jgi:hypothetical protein